MLPFYTFAPPSIGKRYNQRAFRLVLATSQNSTSINPEVAINLGQEAGSLEIGKFRTRLLSGHPRIKLIVVALVVFGILVLTWLKATRLSVKRVAIHEKQHVL